MPLINYFNKFLVSVSLVFLTSAQVWAQEDRKLVFVPGIVGSILSTPDEEVVWGNVSSIRGSQFQRMNLLPASGAPEELVANDVLRDIPLVFGAFEVGLYGDMINFLTGKTSFFDSRTSRAMMGDFVEGDDFFVFPYDWRRSNFANAVALHDFIETNIPDGQYDKRITNCCAPRSMARRLRAVGPAHT